MILQYKNSSDTGEVSPSFIPDPGDGATVIAGPVKKYADNTLSSNMIKLTCDAAIFLVPSAILTTTLKNSYKLISATIAYLALNSYLGAVGDTIPANNYYEVWQWKYYSNYYGANVVMTTIVFYDDSSYENPIDVTYYETDIETL
ncbi:MAG: hypothetical protein ACM3TR_04325 [Caulobacteraceae bacterium]